MKKEKVLRKFAVLSLVMTCVALSPKTAKAAEENIEPKHAKTIKIGDKLYETYDDNDEKHESRYYKFTVPKDIGNKWINIYMTNRIDTRAYLLLYDNERVDEILMESDYLYLNESDILHTAIDASVHSKEMVKLKPGKTYYLEVNSGGDYQKDFKLSMETVADDNWGSIEKASEIKCNTWKKGVLEYNDDVDEYYVKLPNDKKEHTFIINSDEDIKATYEDVNGIMDDHKWIWANDTNSEYKVTGRGQRVYIKIDGEQYANYKIKVTSPAPKKKPAVKKNISTLSINKCKKGAKVVKGKTIKSATVKVTVNGKAYKAVKSNSKGYFTVKTKKLKTGQKVKVTVSKSGYASKTKTTTVKTK